MSNYNVDLECEFIAIILQYPDIFNDVGFVNSNDLSKNYGTIYEVIRLTVENKGTPTPAVLAEKLNAIGVTFDGIEIYDFLNSLLIKPVDKKGAVEIAKKIKKKAVVRKIIESADKLKKEVIEAEKDNKKGSEIIEIVDKYLGNSITVLDEDDTGEVNLDEGMADFLDNLGNNPVENTGFKTPFPLFDGYFNTIEPESVSMIGARTGSGKSTFLMYLLDQVINNCNPKLDIKGLFIDTEMDEDKQRLRLAASRIGCPYYLIKTGQYRKDPIWAPKMRQETEKMRKTKKENLWFKQGHNLTGDDLKNFIKKWYFKRVGRGGNAFVVLDYLKPLIKDMKSGVPEWQVIYQKMQLLKDIAIELKIPIFTAIQLNTSASTKGKSMGEVDDSENALTMSKRLDWLLSFSGILRKKLPEEMAYHGLQYGTHMLIPHKAREQGALGTGHHNLVRIADGKSGKTKYVDNFLCYNVDNFQVQEVCDLRKIADENGWNKIKIVKQEQDNPL